MLPPSPVLLPLPLRHALVAGALAGFVLFFVPLPSGPPHLGYGPELAETYHALYFSFLPFVLLALLGFPAGRRRGAAAALSEILEYVPERTDERYRSAFRRLREVQERMK